MKLHFLDVDLVGLTTNLQYLVDQHIPVENIFIISKTEAEGGYYRLFWFWTE